MKKKKLEIEYSYDFGLLGLTSASKGYKLAWEINNLLHVKLIRKDDVVIHQKNNTECHYSCFSYESEVNTIRLFRNKPNDTDTTRNFLVPEFPHYDYILLSQGEEHLDSKRLQEVLRNIPSIELVAFIPLGALKSKDNFIF